MPLFRCHLCSGCSVTESPGGVGVGSEDHVLGSVRAMCDLSAEHGALLWLLCQGVITQER